MQDSLHGASEHVREVEARVQGMGTNIDKRFDDLTRMMENMAMVEGTPVWQGLGGQRAAESQPFPNQYYIGTPPGQRRANEDARTRVPQFPMGVHREHVNEVSNAIREKYEMYKARPKIGQGGIRFGMVFRDREHGFAQSCSFTRTPTTRARFSPCGYIHRATPTNTHRRSTRSPMPTA